MLPAPSGFSRLPAPSKGGQAVEGPAETRPCDPEGSPRNWLSLHSTGVASSSLGGRPRPRLKEGLGRWVGNLPRSSCFGWAGVAPPPRGPQPIARFLGAKEAAHTSWWVPLHCSPGWARPRVGQHTGEKEAGGLLWPCPHACPVLWLH